MAVTIALDETQSGIGVACPAAYGRVVYIQWVGGTGNINSGTMNFNMEWHYNQQAKNNGDRPINGTLHSIPSYNWDGSMTLPKALYDWLKLQPEYNTAVDV